MKKKFSHNCVATTIPLSCDFTDGGVSAWHKNETVHSQSLVTAWKQLESTALEAVMAASGPVY